MGLISFLGGLATTVGRAAGILAPAAIGTGATIGRTALGTAGAIIRNPFVQSLAGGAGGVALAGGFGGQAVTPGQVSGGGLGGGGNQLSAAAASGAQITELAGGRFMAVAANGDVQLFNRGGMALRPQLIIPAGQRLPGGALVVSTRQNGALIGITKRRRRRAFNTEIRRVRNTIRGCRAVLNAAEKPKRRSGHA